MTTPIQSSALRGAVLNPSVAIEEEFSATILALVRRMCDETKKELLTVFAQAAHDHAMDDVKATPREGGVVGYGSLSAKARATINRLVEKYEPLFNKWAKRATKRMIDRTIKNSAVTLGMSLREVSKTVTLDPNQITSQLQDIIAASTNEAVSLIKLIPTKYLANVQGAVMRSIAGGTGPHDLLPYLEKQYQGNVRHARNVAMDQTRKSYSNMNAARMKAIGVKKFEWLHTGGSREPRALHMELSGQVFDLDKPPYIGDMYGQKVYGLPSQLPMCRCKMRPLVTFDSD